MRGESHRNRFRKRLGADPGLEAVDGSEVDVDLQDALQLLFQGEQSEQAGADGDLDEQVDITVRGVLAPRDAAEHSQVTGTGSRHGREPWPPMAPYSSSQWGVG